MPTATCPLPLLDPVVSGSLSIGHRVSFIMWMTDLDILPAFSMSSKPKKFNRIIFFRIFFSCMVDFFSMQVMLLGFVLLGRSLEEKARIKASSDMNELLVS